jgi:transcriptional regulator with XRE-family HTH domain
MKTIFRKKARALRRKGLSYKEIREKIDVSKSTLSLWLRDIRLKDEYRKRLYTKQIEILSRGTMCQKERRRREIDGIIESAKKEISFPISEEAYRLFGVALYWGEGNKRRDFGITNSDPYLILFMVGWLKRVCKIEPSILKPHLNIYSQQDDLALKRFWSELTGIPLANFGKSYVKPANKGFKKNNLYYGTMHIYVPKATNLLHVVYGWREAVLQNLKNTVNFTERKWISLKETPRPANLQENKNKPL